MNKAVVFMPYLPATSQLAPSAILYWFLITSFSSFTVHSFVSEKILSSASEPILNNIKILFIHNWNLVEKKEHLAS
ncbi:hypothetical protein [Paenibacillus polymyxa]|jgi:hypothetical protein|uniref:hypothetical protein n=1 Tax=Paenibacillus polymyxa TaxID=1406 RepID=UPI00157FF75A|nr:hypothetical protein [Paenibacillus polymyxa]